VYRKTPVELDAKRKIVFALNDEQKDVPMKTITGLKNVVVIAVLVAAVLVAASCAPVTPAGPGPTPTQGAVTLNVTVWTGSQPILDLLNSIGKDFTATHPNVKVAFQTIPFADYFTKLPIMLASGEPPDVGWVDGNRRVFFDGGILQDIGPAVRASTDFDFADFVPSTLEGRWVVGNTVYGIPFSNSPHFILYNKDLFAQAGIDTPDKMIAQGKWTWEELAKAAATIKAKTGKYGWVAHDGDAYTTNFLATFTPIVRAYGGDVWSLDGTKYLMDSPEAVQAFQLYRNMVFVDKSTPPPGEVVTFSPGKPASPRQS